LREPEAVKFLKSIDGKIGIYFHNDADGTTSAALVLALLRKRDLKPKLFCGDIEPEDFRRFARQPMDAAIFLDFPVDPYPELLTPFRDKPVLIIDHHPITNDLNKLGYLYINPRFTAPEVYISVAQICGKLCAKAGLKGFSWLVRLGAVGDRALPGSADEQEAVEIVNAVKAIDREPGLVALANFLSRCSGLPEFIQREGYQRLKWLYRRELERQLQRFEASGHDEINWFRVISPYSITASLCSRIADVYPDRTIIAYTISAGWCKVSARSARYDLGSAFSKAVKAVGGRGGGHPRAAAAKFRAANFERFKRKVLSLLR
jgi:single-stranded DNA-specific DHH superfamily exonuclease